MTQFGTRPNLHNPKFFPQGNIVPRERVPSAEQKKPMIRRLLPEQEGQKSEYRLAYDAGYRAGYIDGTSRVTAIEGALRSEKVFETIKIETSIKYGVSEDLLLTKPRAGWKPSMLGKARHEMMFLLREKTDLSLVEIGRLMGGVHYATVKQGIGRHAARLAASQSRKAEGEG